MDEHHQFYAYVANYVEAHPACAAHVSDYVQAGLQRALNEAYERAGDMEVALTVALAKKFKNADDVIAQKLAKWEGKTSCNWAWLTKK